MIAPDEPFLRPIPKRWIPREMTTAPFLNLAEPRGFLERRYALLINPFYPKDANASFGKHVLTPTLALTSFAATTPAHWRVEYWDENLLDGRPPFDPMPHVVGITVHLTFAHRAYRAGRLVSRARREGDFRRAACALVSRRMRAARRRPRARRRRATLAADPRATSRPMPLQPRYVATYENDYCDDPPPAPVDPAAPKFSDHDQPDRHPRMPQPLRFLLSRDGRPAHAVPHDAIRSRSPPSFWRTISPTRFSSTTISARAATTCTSSAPLFARSTKSGAPPLPSTSPTIPASFATWRSPGCTGVFIGFESLSDNNLADSNKKTPKTVDYARRVRILHDYGIQVNGSFRPRLRSRPQRRRSPAWPQWIEENRLECATFHILTPYPATPLFRQMEAEGRILHRDWTLYDTGHAVFRPKHMTPEELEQGYAWIYQRLFSHSSIWRRRPEQLQAVPLYLAMSYLYKRSNRFWHLLIKHDLVNPVWKPLVEMTRIRHVRYRRRLAMREMPVGAPGQVVSAGV